MKYTATIGAFLVLLGMPHHKGPGIVVKLDRTDVDAMIEAGEGASFAPAGKVFRDNGSGLVEIASFTLTKKKSLRIDASTCS